MGRVKAKTLFKRVLLRRCPVCGRGALLRSHFKVNSTCSVCYVTFWRDPGEALGAMYLDWVVAMATFTALWVALSWFTNLSQLRQFVLLSAAAVAAAIACYPWSRSAWTMLVYLSGGIERPPLRVLPGGRQSPRRSRQRIGAPARNAHGFHRR